MGWLIFAPPQRELLTGTETAHALGMNRRTLYAWEHTSKLAPALRTPGGHRRYRYDDVRACASQMGLAWAQPTAAERHAYELAVERPEEAR